MRGTTIIEYKAFRERADSYLSADDVEGLIDYLSQLPRSGTEIGMVKGLRILKWPLRELGREPKATIGYYFINDRIPLHLISCLSVTFKDPGSKTLELAFAEHS